MTTVTPLQQSPVADLQNAINVCVCYEDSKNVSGESAQQQLPRIRHLLLNVLAKLGEPHALAVERMTTELRHAASEAVKYASNGAEDGDQGIIDQRWARDSAAIICRTQVTWGLGEGL